MSNPNKRRSRRANRTGRNEGERYIRLGWSLYRTRAYQSLKPIPRAAYTELRHLFNGVNNGQIRCSIRQMAKAINCGKDAAHAALLELQHKGLIKCAEPGAFHRKVRHAPLWILTEEEYAGHPPTNDFRNWKPNEKKDGPERRTDGPENRTSHTPAVADETQIVLKPGQKNGHERGSRS